jgi:hypothetical protein
MENSPLLHDDYQFTNLLLRTTLVLELNKEQVTIEILVIVTVVISCLKCPYMYDL